MLDTSGVGISDRFVPFAKRKLHAVEVDITRATRVSEIERFVAAALARIPADDLVRVVLVGEHKPELWKDVDTLSERLSPGRYYLEIKDESHLAVRYTDYARDKSLKGEFIRLVTSDSTLTEKEREDIIATGLYALLGEEYYER